jgi:hypothetical protein
VLACVSACAVSSPADACVKFTHHIPFAAGMANLGTAFMDAGRAKDAYPLFDASLAMYRRLYRAFPSPHFLRSVAVACANVGLAHRASHRLEEATVCASSCDMAACVVFMRGCVGLLCVCGVECVCVGCVCGVCEG